MSRYTRQLALPEITPAHQEFLKSAKIIMVGAGGLGAAALPYLAGAGIGHIAIADHDDVDITNLHRQTIFRESDAGKNKAELTAQYLCALNPDIKVTAISQEITPENAAHLCNRFDLILDGSDNFETKFLLNEMSIATKTPLISAGVEHFMGTVGIFSGHDAEAPCYRCLHPEPPLDACSCADTGILGTVAGLAGLYQAHLALLFFLQIGEVGPGSVLSFDFKNFRMQKLNLQKDPACPGCAGRSAKTPRKNLPDIPWVKPESLEAGCLVIDVRNPEETAADPIPGALCMPLDTLPARYRELPKDRHLVFACIKGIRSKKAAEFVREKGYAAVSVLDRSGKARSRGVMSLLA